MLALLGCLPPILDETAAPLGESGHESAADSVRESPPDSDPGVVWSVVENPNSTITPLVEHDGTFHVEFWSDDVARRRTPQGTGTLPVVGLRAESTYQLQIVVDGEPGPIVEHTTGALPDVTAAWEVRTPCDDDGLLVLMGPAVHPDPESDDGLFLVAVDRAGEIVWYLDPPGVEGLERPVRFDDDGDLWTISGSEAQRYDWSGQLVQSIEVGETLHHDVLPLAGGHILALTQETRVQDVEGLGEDVAMVGDHILELDADGQVVWDWNAFDHLSYEDRDDDAIDPSWVETRESVDWTHANSIELADTGELVVSMRNPCVVLGIDRETDAIAWSLGPDTDQGSPNFCAQHSAHVADGHLTLFDNLGPELSRAAEYDLETDRLTWSWTTHGRFETHGDVQLMEDGAVLVTAAGSRDVLEEARVSQVERDGSVSWALSGFDEHWIYRAIPVTGRVTLVED